MKGLIFSEPMVKAWMEGRKTVTRRLMKPQPSHELQPDSTPEWGHWEWMWKGKLLHPMFAPYLPGETVYIKETWAQIWNQDGCIKPEWEKCQWPCEGCHIEYKADTGAKYPADWPDDSTGDPSCPKWKSPRFMPAWAARSHALIVSVRPERVQEITEEEALREGIVAWMMTDAFRGLSVYDPHPGGRGAFSKLWQSLYPGSWERNDFVFRYELEKT